MDKIIKDILYQMELSGLSLKDIQDHSKKPLKSVLALHYKLRCKSILFGVDFQAEAFGVTESAINSRIAKYIKDFL
jgi:hypothetical protein